jgi:hypothetical protein
MRKPLFAFVLTILLCTALFGQNEKFESPNHEYTFSLPDTSWKMTSSGLGATKNVEYVYGDRSKGHLVIRKLHVEKDDDLNEVIRNEEQGLRFISGYIGGKKENFRGKLSGIIFNYEFVDRSRAMVGKIYFVRANETTVYALRFSGEKDSLRSLGNQTDSIARTFEIKRPK